MSNLTYASYMTKNSTNPVPNWLFNVTFRISNNTVLENKLNELECVNITLPENETTTAEVHFFGTSMTVPVNRKYAGEVTAEFFDKVGRDSLINMITHGVNTKTIDKVAQADKSPFRRREEFIHKIDNIVIDVFPMNVLSKVKGESQEGIVRNIYKRYTLYNPIITKFNYTEGLDASGESALRYSITIHYDYWSIEDDIQEEVDG